LTVSLGSVLSILHNYISWILRFASKVVLDDRLGSRSVTLLSIQGGTGVVRNPERTEWSRGGRWRESGNELIGKDKRFDNYLHSVSSSVRVVHGSPWVILWSWLDVPDIT